MSIFKRSEKASSKGSLEDYADLINLRSIVGQAKMLFNRGDFDGAIKLLKGAGRECLEHGDEKNTKKIQSIIETMQKGHNCDIEQASICRKIGHQDG